MKGKAAKGPIVAIDGPSGVGKTTISRVVAEKLGLRYINTGAMYRAMALAADEAGVDIHSEDALKDFCSNARINFDSATGCISVNGMEYTGRIRSQKAAALASIVSARESVRDFLVAYQRTFGGSGSIIMEGRDIGTVVFPDADIKFFLDASHDARARRRHLELAPKEKAGHEEVSKEIKARDRRDRERDASPLKAAEDAIRIDTTEMGIDEVVKKILVEIDARLKIGNIRS